MELNQGLVGAPTSQTSPKKISQTEQQFLALANSIDYLKGEISLLRDRLSPALREALPEESKDEAAEQSLVPIADGLRKFSRDIEAQSFNSEDILARLEI